ncbi:hypothetical protein D3C78_1970270 [compost metagenome]
MSRTYGDGEGVDPGSRDKLAGGFWVGIKAVCGIDNQIVFLATQAAQLRLYASPIAMA